MDRIRRSTIALSAGHKLVVFDQIFSGLVTGGAEPDIVMIDATHLKAHGTACSLVKKRGCPATNWQNQRQPELKAACTV
jgi:hypothetical protein